ncbi:MAG TPA: hypothetical protein VFB29_02105 [Pseudolabrys sp.]|nr:hypothetical protein [Pseudolabrys sp.]
MAAFGRQSHTSPHPANVHESPTSQDNPGTPTDHTSALLTVIGGDAYAAGLSTDASGTVNNTVNDFGNVTVASGYAVFEATATSPAGDAAAGADTFVSVAGADIVMVFEFDMSFKVGNTVVAVSETSYLAIDIENWSRPNGPLVMDFQGHAALGHHGPEGPHLIPGPSFPSGNLAQVAAVADAHGPNTLASTLTQALTIENHFSYVNGMAIAAA